MDISPKPPDSVGLPSADAAAAASLKLLVKGFNTTERRLLDATVMLSQRRKPPIALLGDFDGLDADVVMVDARDEDAMRWAMAQRWLQDKVVIWVDANRAPAKDLLIHRPVQWPSLPMLLAKALLDSQGAQEAHNHPHAAARAPAAQPHSADPAAPAAGWAVSQPAHNGTAPAFAATKRILVVDDSAMVRTQLRSLLEGLGLNVTDVENGEAGVSAAVSGPYSCVLLDVLMPGIDGYEACRRIKAQHRTNEGPAIVMLTSRTSPFDRIRGKMAGCDAYLTKPVEKKQFYDVLARYVEISLPKS